MKRLNNPLYEETALGQVSPKGGAKAQVDDKSFEPTYDIINLSTDFHRASNQENVINVSSRQRLVSGQLINIYSSKLEF